MGLELMSVLIGFQILIAMPLHCNDGIKAGLKKASNKNKNLFNALGSRYKNYQDQE